MTTPTKTTGTRPARVLPALALALSLAALTGCADSSEGAADHGASKPAAAGTAAEPDAAKTAAETDGPTAASTARTVAPVEVAIPSIGVRSRLMGLGLNKDGTVEVPPPEKGMTAGWYTGAPAPGERGASVIIGHNDTKYGKAVFHDLKKIAKGAEITVRNAAGATARFAVTGTETVSKKAFPTQRVYGETNGRDLRLITCDGGFDAEGHPVDNLIVYATRA
ncbi:class F sortase [Streptomyces sp. NPDC020141]|uniref:class F sortase n=1 Tax=Streptomyces sp. NPDC020141 TaxID=3365065 RepID=UPI0037BBA98A